MRRIDGLVCPKNNPVQLNIVVYTLRLVSAPQRLYSLRLPLELKAALEELKKRDGIPESEAIRRGTVEFLKAKGISVKAERGEKPKRKR